ncbi:unnamed protein product [Urochloa humidicola]
MWAFGIMIGYERFWRSSLPSLAPDPHDRRPRRRRARMEAVADARMEERVRGMKVARRSALALPLPHPPVGTAARPAPGTAPHVDADGGLAGADGSVPPASGMAQ